MPVSEGFLIVSLLLHPRSASERIHRSAVRPGLDSSRSVAAVGRLDGRTRVLAVRDGGVWRRGTREPWTPSTAEQMRIGTVSEVLLGRRFRRARILIAWLPARTVLP